MAVFGLAINTGGVMDVWAHQGDEKRLPLATTRPGDPPCHLVCPGLPLAVGVQRESVEFMVASQGILSALRPVDNCPLRPLRSARVATG